MKKQLNNNQLNRYWIKFVQYNWITRDVITHGLRIRQWMVVMQTKRVERNYDGVSTSIWSR